MVAGGELTVAANGEANAGRGNFTMIGANVTAGQAATLSATGNIDLLAAENTVQVHSTNSSSNASLGVTFALGGAQNGFSFQIGAQGARGLVNGEETTYSNTQIRVGGADTQSIRAQMLGFYSALKTSILNEFELPKSMGLIQTISRRERH